MSRFGVDLVAVGAHPDDAELAFGGVLAACAAGGGRAAVLDATRGERGSRGDAATRAREAEEAARRLGLAERRNLGLPDLGLSAGDQDQRRALVGALRALRPRLVLAPHPDEGHPDHAALAGLVRQAVEEARFARSLASGEPHAVLQLFYAWPAAGADQSGGAGGGGGFGGGVVVDVSASFAIKRHALEAYASQFAPGPGSATRLSTGDFLGLVEARARVAGAAIGVAFGEGFLWRGAAAAAALAALATLAPAAGAERAGSA